MEAYEDLLNWARDQGIELHGIEPRPLPGRGIGVVATKSIKVSHLPDISKLQDTNFTSGK